MSMDMGAWARGQQTGSIGRKCILLLLADEADTWGYCVDVQQADLAAAADCSTDAVSRHTKALEEQGLIVRRRTRRSDGKHARYEYLLQAPDCAETFEELAAARAGEPPRTLQGGDEATDEDAAYGAQHAGPATHPSEAAAGHEAPSAPARDGAQPDGQVVVDEARTLASPSHPAECGVDQPADRGVDAQPPRRVRDGHDASSQVSATPHSAARQSAGSKASSGGGGNTSSSQNWTPQIAAWTDRHAGFAFDFASRLPAGVADRLAFDPAGAPTDRDRIERPTAPLSKFAAQILRLVDGGWHPRDVACRVLAVGALDDAQKLAPVIATRLARLPDAPPATRTSARPDPACPACHGAGQVAVEQPDGIEYQPCPRDCREAA